MHIVSQCDIGNRSTEDIMTGWQGITLLAMQPADIAEEDTRVCLLAKPGRILDPDAQVPEERRPPCQVRLRGFRPQPWQLLLAPPDIMFLVAQAAQQPPHAVDAETHTHK